MDQFASGFTGMGNNWANGVDPDGKWFGIDDVIVAGIGFVVGYVAYGITKKDWGAKALLTGLTTAAIAEVGYLTLWGGLVATSVASTSTVSASTVSSTTSILSATGSYGSISGSVSFAQSFGVSAITSVVKNYSQIQNATGWDAFGLIAGYSALASVRAGFSSSKMEAKLDKFRKFDPDDFFDKSGAFSNGLGGLISKTGEGVLQTYNSVERKWELDNKKWGPILAKGLFIGGVGAYLGKMVETNTDVGELFKKNSFLYNKKEFFSKTADSFLNSVTQYLNELFWVHLVFKD